MYFYFPPQRLPGTEGIPSRLFPRWETAPPSTGLLLCSPRGGCGPVQLLCVTVSDGAQGSLACQDTAAGTGRAPTTHTQLQATKRIIFPGCAWLTLMMQMGLPWHSQSWSSSIVIARMDWAWGMPGLSMLKKGLCVESSSTSFPTVFLRKDTVFLRPTVLLLFFSPCL